MKKIVLSLLLVISVMLFSGCSAKPVDFTRKKTFTCVDVNHDSDTSTTTYYTFSYDDKEILKEFELKSISTFSNEYSANMMYNLFSPVASLARRSGLYFDTKIDNTTVTIITSGSFSEFVSIVVKINNLTGNEVGEIPDATKSAAIEALSGNGTVCRDN